MSLVVVHLPLQSVVALDPKLWLLCDHRFDERKNLDPIEFTREHAIAMSSPCYRYQ